MNAEFSDLAKYFDDIETRVSPWAWPTIHASGQTTGNIWAPKYYIFLVNDLPHRNPPPKKKKKKKKKKIRKIPKIFQAKAIEGHILWLNLKKNSQISFSQ